MSSSYTTNVPGFVPAHPPAAMSVLDNPEASRFEAALDGQLAVSEYSLSGDTITFTHTAVPEALQGRGVASRLIGEALAMARERGWKVVPQCSAVAAYMRKHKETQDLLAPSARPAFLKISETAADAT